MKNGFRSFLFLLVFFIGTNICVAENLKSEVRISNLLPYLIHPPLVEPFLPSDFTLGKKDNDPYFSQGYYWGNSKTIKNYFENPSSLNSCIIRAQVSSNVTQVSLDRFSSDGKINDLTASGFTEIIINKGKWGIFPYRELHAKGPKGRHYYQLWVGLNEESGATIYFQFLYPEYLSEPTQNQKKIWNDFIQKTSFLSLQDLMAFHEAKSSKQRNQAFRFCVEKRRIDNRFVVLLEASDDLEIDVHEIKDYNLLTGIFEKSYVELQVDIRDRGHVKSDNIKVNYSVVEDFTYYPTLFFPKKMDAYLNYILLLKNK